MSYFIESGGLVYLLLTGLSWVCIYKIGFNRGWRTGVSDEQNRAFHKAIRERRVPWVHRN